MTPTAAPPTAPPQPPAAPPVAPQPPVTIIDRVLLTGIRWQTYEALLADLGDRHIRLTYDRGSLEIMAPLFRHENYAGALGRLVEILAEELNVRFKSAWSTTFRREDFDRGLEPDRCFYIQNVAAVVGKMELNLPDDPPPDLAVEIDITSSSLDRMGIYGRLGVPEVWRFDGAQFQVGKRRPDGTYEIIASSLAFPALPVAEVADLLHQVAPMEELGMMQTIRAWVRARAVPKP